MNNGLKKITEANRKKSTMLQLEYNLNPRRCLFCDAPIAYQRRFNCKFCDSICRAKYSYNKTSFSFGNCLNCHKPVTRKDHKYCSNECQGEYAYKQYITNWLAGKESGNKAVSGTVAISNHVRRWILEIAQNKCQECGWGRVNPTTGKIPLHVHHKDGDPYNTKPDNIEVLCPSCHSITPNFGVYGRGRSGKQNKLYTNRMSV